jgi:putative transposase
MIGFIDDNRAAYGVEPICRVLPIAPSTYHARVARRADPAKASSRARRDVGLRAEIRRVFEANFGVYGVRKVWRQLGREGVSVARCTVARLMRQMGLRGVVRGKETRTTIAGKAPCPADRVNRQFRSARPNLLWLADFTYVATWQGFVYVAFVIDAFARRIVGWRVSRTAHAGFVLDALEQALHDRRPVQGSGLVHHSDRGVQYLSIRYSDRLAVNEIVASVGSKGDSYDNAMAESFNGLYKWELIYRQGPWAGIEDIEFATMTYVEWFNHRRLHGEITTGPGYTTPATFEADHYRQHNPTEMAESQ